MSSHRAPKLAVHHGIALGQFPAGDAELNEFVVSPGRCGHGRFLPLDVLSSRHGWYRPSCQTLICGLDYLFTGDARSARFRPIVMEEERRKKNRRMVIALLIFAILFTLLIILWKLSIYQKT